MATQRLNKYIAHHSGISRREADTLIENGRITINGKATELGAQVTDTDTVELDGKLIVAKQRYTYLLLHKPTGYICSRNRQGDTPTIFELLPREYQALKPVGRLDKDSSGIILLTDDGDFAHHMTHPRFQKTKVYEVELNKPLSPLHQQMISDYGIMLEDGKSKFQVNSRGDSTYEVIMQEGRNRQIRRTFNALSYTVKKLHRTHFGNYYLDTMPEGKYQLTNN